MALNPEQARHERATAELLERLWLPSLDGSGLAWFDGKTREILIWITPKGQRDKAMMIPNTFEGYPVRVEPLPNIEASA